MKEKNLSTLIISARLEACLLVPKNLHSMFYLETRRPDPSHKRTIDDHIGTHPGVYRFASSGSAKISAQ
jgi:hypothetical protein